MKKLLIVTDPWLPKVDGVVRTVENRKKILERRGFEVLVVHPGLFSSMPFFLYPELRIALFPGRRLKKIMAEFGPNYVHVETEGTLGFAMRSLCRRRGMRFTSSYHTHLQLYVDLYARLPVGFLLKPAFAFLRWFHGAATHTVVSTFTLKAELEKHGFRNLVVCPLGVDTELFKRNPASHMGADLPRPIFAFFSRVAPEKSPEEFLKLDLPGTKLVIGDGPSRVKLEKKYPSAVFAGFQRGQNLVDWLSHVNVVVFPSLTETFGLVALESLSCSVPVAAHDVLGPRDVITSGTTGYLSDDLQKAALDCLGLNPEECRKRALEFSWEASTDAFIKNLVPVK